MRKLRSRISAVRLTGLLLVAITLAGCDTEENPLTPYEGSRPLIVQDVTTSYAPDISWVGGRVAAVGINKGEDAALDSSLVWIYTAGDNDLDSPLYVRDVLDSESVTKFGGTPSDSLEDGETYTLWLAEKEAYDAALSSGQVDEFSFVDTTFTASYLLNGFSGGGVDVDFTIFRDQRLLSDFYTVIWEPADITFRRVAIRNGTIGGFTNLVWHIVMPDDQPASISSPLIIGETPDDAVVATEWDGFATGNHVFWAVTDEWEGESFGFRTDGYAFFQILGSNFE